MKVLLINPPIPKSYYNREYYLPSGLLYLASVLEKNGEEVRILDLKTFSRVEKSVTQKEFEDFYGSILLDTISQMQPDLVGFGCLYSGHFPDLLNFSILLKNKFKGIPIILGGIHASIYPLEILSNCPSFDFIIIGEAEDSIVALVNTIKNKSLQFDKIEGLAYRKDGKVLVNNRSQYIKDLDRLPFPAYHLIDPKDYYEDTTIWHNPKNLPINTSIPIITSRSCPNRCSFCSMFKVMGPKWRARSPENVVSEIEYLYNKYNHRHFSFMDDNLTLSKSRIMDICNLIIKKKLNIQFETPNGISINTLDREVLDALVSAGLVRVYLAIESGSSYIRNKIMKKHLSQDKIYEIINLVKSYKQLYVKAYFIIGMPEENKETLMETYNMIRDIKVDRVYIHNVVPFPGTEVFEQALRDNLLVDIDPSNLYKSGDLYITNYKRIFIKPYKLDIEDLQDFRQKCVELIAEQKLSKGERPLAPTVQEYQ